MPRVLHFRRQVATLLFVRILQKEWTLQQLCGMPAGDESDDPTETVDESDAAAREKEEDAAPWRN